MGRIDGAGRGVRRLLDQRPGAPGPHGPPSIAASPRPAARHPGRPRRDRCSPTPSVVSVQALLELARAYLALTDPDGARTVLRQVSDILQQRPDLACCRRGRRATSQGRDDRKARRWRLVPHHRRVAGPAAAGHHLTFREIAERLYVSPYTVKSRPSRSTASSACRRGARPSSAPTGRLCWAMGLRQSLPNARSGPTTTMTIGTGPLDPMPGGWGGRGWHVLPCASTTKQNGAIRFGNDPGMLRHTWRTARGCQVAGTTTARPSQRPQRRRIPIEGKGPPWTDRCPVGPDAFHRPPAQGRLGGGSSPGVRRRPCLGQPVGQGSTWSGYASIGLALCVPDRGAPSIGVRSDGTESVEEGPGDFVLIPKGVVRRGESPGTEANEAIVFRVGEGGSPGQRRRPLVVGPGVP